MGSPASHRGAQIRTGDLSDPNGARYQAAPHPETAHRLASPGAIRPDFRGYVAFSENEEDRMNVVTLIGNLATDVDTREVGDKQVAKFLLAVDRRSKDGGADFVWISAWERQAELCNQYLSKGRRVAVDGYLRSRTWEDDGKRRDAIEVVARSVEFLSPPIDDARGEVVPFEAAVAS